MYGFCVIIVAADSAYLNETKVGQCSAWDDLDLESNARKACCEGAFNDLCNATCSQLFGLFLFSFCILPALFTAMW